MNKGEHFTVRASSGWGEHLAKSPAQLSYQWELFPQRVFP